jgi:hypothetical protein
LRPLEKVNLRARTHQGNWQPQRNRNCVSVCSICAAPFSNMCSTQADNNSRKLRLRCGCQFPWCALGLNHWTDGQPASLSWKKALIWGLRPDFYYCQTVAGLLMWGALSEKWTGLSFTIAAGPRQRSHSRVRVPTASDSRLPSSSPPTTRRVTVEVLNLASTRDTTNVRLTTAIYILETMLFRREITRKYAINIMIKHAHSGDRNLCYKPNQKTKSMNSNA